MNEASLDQGAVIFRRGFPADARSETGTMKALSTGHTRGRRTAIAEELLSRRIAVQGLARRGGEASFAGRAGLSPAWGCS